MSICRREFSTSGFCPELNEVTVTKFTHNLENLIRKFVRIFFMKIWLFRKGVLDQAPSHCNRIVVCLGGNFGGGISAFMQLEALLLRYKNAKIYALTNNKAVSELVSIFFENAVVPLHIESIGVLSYFGQKASRGRESIRNANPDLFIFHHNLDVWGSLPWWSRFSVLGFFDQSKYGFKWFNAFGLPERYGLHSESTWKDYNEPIIHLIGCPNRSCRPGRASLVGLIRNQPYFDFKKGNTRFIVVQATTWSEQAQKAYPSHCLTEVCRLLLSAGHSVALVGESGHSKGFELLASHHRFINACGLTSAHLIHLVLHADLVLAHDSGIMHLAGYLSKQTVVIEGPTSVAKTWAYPAENLFVVTAEDKKPCYKSSTGLFNICQSRSCLSIKPKDIANFILELI